MNLYNDQTWTTQEGRTLRLEDMTFGHRINLLAFLRRHAESLKFSEDLSLCRMAGPNGEAATDAFEDACDQQFSMSAAQWLEETPLVMRLRELNEKVEL